MLLALASDIQTDLGYSSMPNILAAINAALEQATEVVAAAIGHEFDQTNVVDTFFVKDSTFHHHNYSSLEARLSRGFVASTPPIVAIQSLPPQTFPWRLVSYASNEQVDVSSSLVVNYEKGVVIDATNRYWNQVLTVTYTAGFPVSPIDPCSYDLTVVPGWLQQAAKMTAKVALQSNPSLEDPKIKMDTKLMQAQLNVLLSRHLRYAPAALLPASSMATPTGD